MEYDFIMKYPPGNEELVTMIRKKCPFDCNRAREIIGALGDIDQGIRLTVEDENSIIYTTTYMHEACDYNNLKAVQLLFDFGSDPNYENLDLTHISPLWSLMYRADNEKDNNERYEIAKLFFAKGANPNIISDDCHESLYQWAVCREIDPPGFDTPGKEYEYSFLLLLEQYGGGQEEKKE